jgi:hypothetical protein
MSELLITAALKAVAQAQADERARIVAWLRGIGFVEWNRRMAECGWDWGVDDIAQKLADVFENGEHQKTAEPDDQADRLGGSAEPRLPNAAFASLCPVQRPGTNLDQRGRLGWGAAL